MFRKAPFYQKIVKKNDPEFGNKEKRWLVFFQWSAGHDLVEPPGIISLLGVCTIK